MLNTDYNTKFATEGLTFDDVLLVPSYTDFLPHETDLSVRLAKEIHLNAPLMTAAMDTITEAAMAIAIAREGGIGVIHKNMSIERQADEVDRVKRSENGVIVNPFFLSPDHFVYDAEKLMGKYRISGVPICEQGKLVGIITNRGMRFITDQNVQIKYVMTSQNLVTAPEGTTLEQAQEVLRKYKIEKLPIVDAQGNLKGLITIKDIEKMSRYPLSARDSGDRLVCGAAIGVTKDMMDRVDALVNAQADLLVLDSAHGESENILHAIGEVKKKYPDVALAAGNIATAAAAQRLIDAGADCIKVGMGPGSICTTRVVAGIGVPQITAVYDVACVAAKHNIPVIADGGIKYSGDIVKAIAAGASAVMIGSLMAGCEEAPGEVEIYQGRRFKTYRGMGSVAAMAEGSKDRYFQSEQCESQKLVPEGVEGRVPYKGTVSETVFQMLGGLRSGMGYCGCRTISELHQNAQFIRISSASLIESHPHDIYITKEAPNYSVNL